MGLYIRPNVRPREFIDRSQYAAASMALSITDQAWQSVQW